MIESNEKVLYANLLSKFMQGDMEQSKLASLLGYRLLRRTVPLDEILALHSRALRSCLTDDERNGNGVHTLSESMHLLESLLRGYSESYRDALSSLEQTSRELEVKAGDLERQVEERTRELEDSRRELQQKLEEISRDQIAMLSMLEDQNRINRELRATREKLASSEKFAILGKLSLGLSHELRNPLGVIESSAALLENSLGPRERDLVKWTERIREQTRICNRVIEGLLGFSLHDRRADDLFLVESAVRRAVENAKAGGRIQLALRSEKPLWAVGDEEQIVQAVECIITNGLEAMEAGGILTITLESERGKGPRDPSSARISVTDHGPGIEERELSLVFEPFHSTKEGHLGLGLPLALAIARRHRGTITIKSTPGEGTIVTVQLPLARADVHGEEYDLPRRR